MTNASTRKPTSWLRKWCGVALVAAALLLTTNAYAKGGGSSSGGSGSSGGGGSNSGPGNSTKPPKPTPTPKPAKLDNASKNEIAWLEKTIDINASGFALAAAETAHTTNTELLALSATVTTSVSLQQTTLEGFLLTFYNITYTPRVENEVEMEHEVESEDMSTADALFLDELISFEHKIQGQAAQAKRLKHPQVMAFALSLSAPAQAVINLARSFEQVLENENEMDD